MLLPLLASKKLQDPMVSLNILSMLQYDDAPLTISDLEHAMLTCMAPDVDCEAFLLSSWLSVQSSSAEFETARPVQALRLLIRSVTLKGLFELECLDFEPCFAGLVCGKLSGFLPQAAACFVSENPPPKYNNSSLTA